MLSSAIVFHDREKIFLEEPLQVSPVRCLPVVRDEGLLLPVLPAFPAVDPYLADELRVVGT